jgi:hypothetical protein
MAKPEDIGRKEEQKHNPGFESKHNQGFESKQGQGIHDQGFESKQGQSFGQQAKDVGTAVKDKASETLSSATEKGKEALESGRQMASNLGDKANEAVAGVGGQMRNIAGRLRDQLPHEGMIGTAADTIAGTLESGAHYLEEHDLRAMMDDVVGVVRTYPIPSVLIGVGLGFLLGRTIRS